MEESNNNIHSKGDNILLCYLYIVLSDLAIKIEDTQLNLNSRQITFLKLFFVISFWQNKYVPRIIWETSTLKYYLLFL